jgi:hypothetical protein
MTLLSGFGRRGRGAERWRQTLSWLASGSATTVKWALARWLAPRLVN